MESSYAGRDVGLAFLGGFLSAVFVGVIIGLLAMRMSDVYGLGHWKLNARMPLTTMWMNLGYWCVNRVTFVTKIESRQRFHLLLPD